MSFLCVLIAALLLSVELSARVCINQETLDSLPLQCADSEGQCPVPKFAAKDIENLIMSIPDIIESTVFAENGTRINDTIAINLNGTFGVVADLYTTNEASLFLGIKASDLTLDATFTTKENEINLKDFDGLRFVGSSWTGLLVLFFLEMFLLVFAWWIYERTNAIKPMFTPVFCGNCQLRYEKLSNFNFNFFLFHLDFHLEFFF
eukprot:TRINITY_DN7385_c0_g1_i1.p1 TRINITY_DN7385_c0_g1~~TRINITY_DN7385_c0_g1_i1.p1  ORF type:complete len:205 (-),score=41.34 TRINITY_DN7385_c0_g1_i1:261-875(-)